VARVGVLVGDAATIVAHLEHHRAASPMHADDDV
jgi:hypothetical protein